MKIFRNNNRILIHKNGSINPDCFAMSYNTAQAGISLSDLGGFCYNSNFIPINS